MDSVVYDLTKFSLVHPGGRSILLEQDTGTYGALRNSNINWLAVIALQPVKMQRKHSSAFIAKRSCINLSILALL